MGAARGAGRPSAAGPGRRRRAGARTEGRGARMTVAPPGAQRRAGPSVHPRSSARPQAWDPSSPQRRGSPRASALLLPLLGKGHEEATAHVGRSG